MPELKTVLPNADFVIEGYVDPREPLRDEGPFGDHTGYYTLPEEYPSLPRHRHHAPPAQFCRLVARTALRYFAGMKTLTVEEAVAGLGLWMERALAGEQIQIRKGDAVVELRPTQRAQSAATEALPPREALRRLQEEARLKPEQAAQYLREVREERLAAEARRSA